jgi:hypothetical protein
LRQQDQMEVAATFDLVAALRLRAVTAFAGRKISLATNDRFDGVLTGFLKKFYGPEHIAVIGHRNGRHP